jgi:hypothetical protein
LKFIAQFFDHPLDQEIAQIHTAQPRLAIRDRIEHRHLHALRVRACRFAPIEQRRNRARHHRQQRDLDENQRLLRQYRVEKRKQPAVGLQAPAQVAPAVDFMDRLVVDDLLEQVGGRAPVDALQLQESRIEPGREQMAEIGIDRRELRMLAQPRQQLRTHLYDGGRAGRTAVQPAQQLLARRLGGARQRDQVGRHAAHRVTFGQAQHLARVGIEFEREHLEKTIQRLGRQAPVSLHRLAGEGDAVGLAALGEQLAAQLEQAGQIDPFRALRRTWRSVRTSSVLRGDRARTARRRGRPRGPALRLPECSPMPPLGRSFSNQAAGASRRSAQRHSSRPAAIIGSDSNWPMVRPNARMPRNASGWRANSAMNRNVP